MYNVLKSSHLFVKTLNHLKLERGVNYGPFYVTF